MTKNSEDSPLAQPLFAGRDIQWLATEGRWIVNREPPHTRRLLRGVNVCGMEFDATGETASVSLLESICEAWDINIVRLPINQTWWLQNEDGTYRSLIAERVQALKARQVYTLIALQWINTRELIAPLPNEDSVTMWRSLAATFQDEPAVLYDLYTEPHPRPPAEHMEWRRWAQRLIATVRSVHPRALIWVSGIGWGYDLKGFIAEPLLEPHLVYSTHIYPVKPGSGGDSPPGDDAWWAGLLRLDRPVFIGEFGPGEEEFDNTTRMDRYLEPLLNAFEVRKVGWTAWSWHCKPYLTDPQRSGRLTVFGERVAQRLKQRAVCFRGMVGLGSNAFSRHFLSGGWPEEGVPRGVRTVPHLLDWEQWVLVNPDAPGSTAPLRFQDTVALESRRFPGNYLSGGWGAGPDFREVRLAPNLAGWERWVLVNPAAPGSREPVMIGDTVALRSQHFPEHALSGGWPATEPTKVVRMVPHLDAWEEWTLVPTGVAADQALPPA